MTLNGVNALFFVISANSGSFPAHCVKVHVRYLISWWVLVLYWQRYCTARQQRASAKLCGVVQGMELRNFRRGRHLYSAGRPWCWASAHILVFILNLRDT